jgi:hypothetical protein
LIYFDEAHVFTYSVYTGGNVSTPTAPPTTPFRAYLVEDGVVGEFLGGSYDNISAVTVACAAYQIMQRYNPRTNVAAVVYDDLDAIIAWIGRYMPIAEILPLPAEEES